MCKAGFARDDASTDVFPSTVKHQNSSSMCNNDFVGHDAPTDVFTYIEWPSQPPGNHGRHGAGRQWQSREYPHPGIKSWSQQHSTLHRFIHGLRLGVFPSYLSTRVTTCHSLDLSGYEPTSFKKILNNSFTTTERDCPWQRKDWGAFMPWHHEGAVLHCPGLGAGDYHRHCLQADWRPSYHRRPEVQKNQQLDHEYEADIRKYEMRWPADREQRTLPRNWRQQYCDYLFKFVLCFVCVFLVSGSNVYYDTLNFVVTKGHNLAMILHQG